MFFLDDYGLCLDDDADVVVRVNHELRRWKNTRGCLIMQRMTGMLMT